METSNSRTTSNIFLNSAYKRRILCCEFIHNSISNFHVVITMFRFVDFFIFSFLSSVVLCASPPYTPYIGFFNDFSILFIPYRKSIRKSGKCAGTKKCKKGGAQCLPNSRLSYPSSLVGFPHSFTCSLPQWKTTCFPIVFITCSVMNIGSTPVAPK